MGWGGRGRGRCGRNGGTGEGGDVGEEGGERNHATTINYSLILITNNNLTVLKRTVVYMQPTPIIVDSLALIPGGQRSIQQTGLTQLLT